MIEVGQNQQPVDIHPAIFQNDDPLNSQLNNTDKILVALQPTY